MRLNEILFPTDFSPASGGRAPGAPGLAGMKGKEHTHEGR